MTQRSAQESDLILTDEIDAPIGVVGQHEHIADAAKHRRVPDQQRPRRQRHALPPRDGLVAVARRRLHRRCPPRRTRAARMQRLPEQALDLLIVRRRRLALCDRNRERDRRQRAERHLARVERRPLRTAWRLRAARADRDRVIDLPRDLQILARTAADPLKAAGQRPGQVVIPRRRRGRAVQRCTEDEVSRKERELGIVHQRREPRVAQQLEHCGHSCRAVTAAVDVRRLHLRRLRPRRHGWERRERADRDARLRRRTRSRARASTLARGLGLLRLTAAALAGGRIVVAWTHIITPIALSRFLFAINTICRAAPIGALAIPPVLRYTA